MNKQSRNRQNQNRQSENKKRNREILQWIIPITLLVLFIISLLIEYTLEYKKKTENTLAQAQESVAYELGVKFYSDLDILRQIGVPMASLLTGDENVFTDAEVAAMLSKLENSTSAYRALIVSADGEVLLHAGYGEKTQEITVPDKDTVQNGFSKAFVDGETGEKAIAVSVPIGRDRLLYLYYPLKRFQDMPNLANGANTYMVMEKDGSIIAVAGEENAFTGEDGNLFETLKEAAFEKGSLNDMMVSTQIGNKGHAICSVRGEKRYISYAPAEKGQWIIAAVTKMSFVESQAKEEWRSLRGILFKLAVSFCIFFIVVAVIGFLNGNKYNKESKALLERAETDLLTGLLNKISTETHIKDYLEHAGPDRMAMMCVLDIDNFKKINDTMGHAFGDEVLSALGHRIKSEFRVSDIIGRTGGDEFIIFLKDIDDWSTVQKEADKVARFFRNFKVGEYTKYSATASIGVVVYPRDGGDYDSLYRTADQALYKAKKRGKNQLAFYRDVGENAPAGAPDTVEQAEQEGK